MLWPHFIFLLFFKIMNIRDPTRILVLWSHSQSLSHKPGILSLLCCVLTLLTATHLSWQCYIPTSKSLILGWCTSLFSALATLKVPLEFPLSEQLMSHDTAKLSRNSTLHLNLQIEEVDVLLVQKKSKMKEMP